MSRTGRCILILLSVSLSAFVWCRYNTPVSDVPTSYALCSRDGDNIYTVDSSAPVAQCLVVRDGLFVDVGSLGQSRPRLAYLFAAELFGAEAVRDRWSRAVRSDLNHTTPSSELPIRFVKHGAVVVPGMTGER